MKTLLTIGFLNLMISVLAGVNCNDNFQLTQKYYTITFGEALNFQVKTNSDLTPSWKVLGDNKLIHSGVGKKTSEIRFAVPGNYFVIFELDEMSGDKHQDTAFVEVIAKNLHFDITNAILSQPINYGTSIDGTTLKVLVSVDSYFGESIKYGPSKSYSTGTEGLELIYDETIELTPGTHELVFKIKGTPQNSGPAQLSLFSPIGEGYFYNLLIK